MNLLIGSDMICLGVILLMAELIKNWEIKVSPQNWKKNRFKMKLYFYF